MHTITSVFQISGVKIPCFHGEPENGHLGASGGQRRFLGLNLCTKLHPFACGYENPFLVWYHGSTGLNLGFGWVSMHLAWSHAWIMHFLAMFHYSGIRIT